MEPEISALDSGFPKYILKKLQEKARNAHYTAAVKLPGNKVMRKLMQRFCPLIVDNARTMSRRRIHVLNDPFPQNRARCLVARDCRG